MNGGQIRTWLMLAACVVVYTGATSAGKHIVSGSDMRRDYANSMNVDPDTLQPETPGRRTSLPDPPIGILSWP